MNSIGGYFELELRKGGEYHNHAIQLNSGRNALEFILLLRKYSRVFVPYYTCDAILEPFKKLKVKYEFYSVDRNLEPIFNYAQIKPNEAFLYTNYFGLKDRFLSKLAHRCGNLIVDNSQAFFSKPIKDISTFYSCRKFFGVPDGAYLYLAGAPAFDLRLDHSENRFAHLLKRIEYGAETGYPDFKANESRFIGQSIKQMSKLTNALLGNIDYKSVRKKRIDNFLILHEKLSKYNELDIHVCKGSVPMVYPFLTTKPELKQKLMERKIWVPTYWPNVLKWTQNEAIESHMTRNLIPLPVDQRVTPENLELVLTIIMKYFKGQSNKLNLGMDRKKIAVIGANSPLLHHYKQAKELGYEVHSFAWENGAVCKEIADYFYPISFTEKEKILDVCKKLKIDGVLSFTLESALPTVNYIAEKLTLPGNPRSCLEFTSDKFAMRRQLSKNKILVPEYQLIRSEIELHGIHHQYPLIVKPIDSGGSRGVTKVNNETELIEAFRRAITYSKLGAVLVEQYIDGREFSVEYLSNKGKHCFIAITDKVTTGEPYFVELEHHQPAQISEAQKKKIIDITEKTLTALHIYSSASHTEIKMDSNGDLYIIEMGARMGGDMIGSDLVKLSTSYDYVKGCIEVATDDFTPPNIKNDHFAGIYFLAQETEYVGQYILHSNDYPEIVQKEIHSNKLLPIKESGDRAGFIIYQADRKFDINKNIAD